jgi:hypothetical protein
MEQAPRGGYILIAPATHLLLATRNWPLVALARED